MTEDRGRLRVIWLMAAAGLLAAVLVAKLVYWQVLEHRQITLLAARQHRHPAPGRREPPEEALDAPVRSGETWRGWLDAWAEYRTEVEEYRELDEERVLVLTHDSGRGKASGLELPFRSHGTFSGRLECCSYAIAAA